MNTFGPIGFVAVAHQFLIPLPKNLSATSFYQRLRASVPSKKLHPFGMYDKIDYPDFINLKAVDQKHFQYIYPIWGL
jgi:hypothetical protein